MVENSRQIELVWDVGTALFILVTDFKFCISFLSGKWIYCQSWMGNTHRTLTIDLWQVVIKALTSTLLLRLLRFLVTAYVKGALASKLDARRVEAASSLPLRQCHSDKLTSKGFVYCDALYTLNDLQNLREYELVPTTLPWRRTRL